MPAHLQHAVSERKHFKMVAKDPIFFGNSLKLLQSYFTTLSELLRSWASQFFRKSCIKQSSQTSFASLAEKARNPVRKALRNPPGPRSGTSSPAGAGFATIAKQFRNSCEIQRP
ncbi:hypothetical protein PGTUg99_032380 [Puccinia graminis f. sp. tritici]|uniref:Uncharacterized protein n=1 Tax=Puccinia graminis f. sp. tritici TaxID=56615 RepID=A0A5B0SEK2_PUCGR|nr:hypothetical protein PGTUg99_032380 [Puccinia graminis f. sp. tritici]